MNQSTIASAGLYRFLQEVYGNLSAMTHIEVEVEALSGGTYGTPHLEAIAVRVYSGPSQLLPNFETLPYWQEILAAYPDLFQGCETHQDRLDVIEEHFDQEHLYLEYEIDWPHPGGKVVSPLRFTPGELIVLALQYYLARIGEQYTSTPIPGHPGCIKIETPFQFPDGTKIGLYVDGRNGLTVSDDGTVINSLLLRSTSEFLPLHLSAWITTICAEQHVQEKGGRFVIRLEKEEDLACAIERLIETVLQIAALRSLLLPPSGEMFAPHLRAEKFYALDQEQARAFDIRQEPAKKRFESLAGGNAYLLNYHDFDPLAYPDLDPGEPESGCSIEFGPSLSGTQGHILCSGLMAMGYAVSLYPTRLLLVPWHRDVVTETVQRDVQRILKDADRKRNTQQISL